jgi:hypothetical protein
MHVKNYLNASIVLASDLVEIVLEFAFELTVQQRVELMRNQKCPSYGYSCIVRMEDFTIVSTTKGQLNH